MHKTAIKLLNSSFWFPEDELVPLILLCNTNDLVSSYLKLLDGSNPADVNVSLKLNYITKTTFYYKTNIRHYKFYCIHCKLHTKLR